MVIYGEWTRICWICGMECLWFLRNFEMQSSLECFLKSIFVSGAWYYQLIWKSRCCCTRRGVSWSPWWARNWCKDFAWTWFLWELPSWVEASCTDGGMVPNFLTRLRDICQNTKIRWTCSLFIKTTGRDISKNISFVGFILNHRAQNT